MSATWTPVETFTANFISSTFFYLLSTVITLWVVYYRMKRQRLYKLADKIPGPPGLPILGNATMFMGNSNRIFDTAVQLSATFPAGSPVKCWIGPRLLIFLTDPRDVEIILSSQDHIDKAPEYRLFKPWLGNGLLISTGEKWRAHRKIIAPTFHLNVLKNFIKLFNVNSLMAVEKMRKLGNQEFDVHHYMSECTVEILLETAMGVDKKTQKASGFEYAMAVMKMCDILHLRHTKLWLRPDLFFGMTKYAKEQTKHLDYIHQLTHNIMQEKKKLYSKKKEMLNKDVIKESVKETTTKTMKDDVEVVKGSSFGQSAGLKDDLDVDYDDVGEKKREAFLDLLLELNDGDANVLSDEEIREQVDTIMFEGHDTTAAGSSFFLCMMGAHPDAQEKVVQELYDIFGDSERPITFEDTLQMKYMERCIMETLRLFPPVPIIARQLKEEVKLGSSDLVLPAECTIVIGTYKLHRSPQIYPNPDVFNPDNFLPEVTSNRHYYAFVPFSAGPRSCVGRKYAMLKLKVLLATVLRNFKVYSDKKENEWKLQADIILKRNDGFNIRLEPRKMKRTAL